MEHNSEGLEDDFLLQMGDFQVPYLFSGVYQTSKSLLCFLLVSVFFFNHCKLRRFWPEGWLGGCVVRGPKSWTVSSNALDGLTQEGKQ